MGYNCPYVLSECHCVVPPKCVRPDSYISLRRLCCHLIDKEAGLQRRRGQEQCPDLMPKLPLTTLTSSWAASVVLPGTKKSQLFSDQNVFHNKPSGAFLHRTGMSLRALLAVSLLISMKMEVFEVIWCRG